MSAFPHVDFSGRHLFVAGCGYVGTAVVERALAQRMAVTALTRNPATARMLQLIGAKVVVAELSSNAWHDSVPAADYAVNCVSGGGGIEGYRRSYVDGMASLVQWLRRGPEPRHVIYTSSTSVYPQGGGALVDESAPVQGSEERTAILIEAENVLLQADIARATVLRLAGLYGPGRHNLLDQVRSGTVSGKPDVHLNLVHRDDVAAAIFAVLGLSSPTAASVLNVVDDGRATKGEIVTWLAQQIGAATPAFTGVPAPGRRLSAPDRIVSNSRLKQQMHWSPKYPTYREGYRALLG